jgi:hypothetical protein
MLSWYSGSLGQFKRYYGSSEEGEEERLTIVPLQTNEEPQPIIPQLSYHDDYVQTKGSQR